MVRSPFFMFLVVMTAGTGLVGCDSQSAKPVTPCDLGEVPFQFIRLEAKPVITVSEAKTATSSLPGFPTFVNDVTEHLASKLAQEKLCLDSAESKERSLLQFVTLPLDSIPDYSAPPLEVRESKVCRITSPWADVIIERKPVPSVRGIFRYNERQLLADQAVLFGAKNMPKGMAEPMSRRQFDNYAYEYMSSEIYHKPAAKPIEERVPADLLWVFHRANHGVPGAFPGAAGGSAREAMRMHRSKYVQLVTALIDQCFESEGADLKYDSILDVADLISLEEYKIEESIMTFRVE